MADEKFKGRATADIQAEHDAALAQGAAAVESLSEHQAELSKRSNARALLINSVMLGQSDALSAAGVPAEAIKEAEAWVADEKARAKAHQEANPLTPDEQALAMLHPSDPNHAALHERVVAQQAAKKANAQ